MNKGKWIVDLIKKLGMDELDESLVMRPRPKPIEKFPDIIGMTEIDAYACLQARGISAIKIVEKNGQSFIGTTDYVPGRVSLFIKNDRVFRCTEE